MVLPIVTANIINDVTTGNPNTYNDTLIQSLIMVGLILLNIPMNYMYTRYKSLATRYAETGLRRALVKTSAIVNLISYRDTIRAAAIKIIIRDVEAVETLSTQMLISTLNIALNVAIALTATISKA